MKKLIIFLLILFPIIARSQNSKIDSLTSQVKYDTIYKTNYNKDAMYLKLKTWSDNYFVSSKAAIEQDSRELGQIFISSSLNIGFILTELGNKEPTEKRVFFKCRLYIKDNKVRLIITSIKIDNFLYDQHLIELLNLRADNYLHTAFKVADLKFKDLSFEILRVITYKTESEF